MIESVMRAPSNATTEDSILGNEAELLLCCGHYSMDPDQIVRAQELLDGQLGWKRLFEIARLHRILPLLYRNLNQIGAGLVPQAFLTELRQHHLGNASRNLFLTKELLSLLNLFEKAGIPVVPFKGPMLASLAYGDISWREFDDLDILVPREHALKGVELLTSQGYLRTYTMSETEEAKRAGVALPILESILPSNRLQIEAARIKLHEFKASKIGILGLSFKPGTDDLRESPVIALIRDLWQDGADLTVFDPDVELDKMLGSNREYLERQLPQIRQILRTSIEDAVREREIIVVNQKRPEFVEALGRLNGSTAVLDLVRLQEERTFSGSLRYRGISW